jgi:hypothetical protein
MRREVNRTRNTDDHIKRLREDHAIDQQVSRGNFAKISAICDRLERKSGEVEKIRARIDNKLEFREKDYNDFKK